MTVAASYITILPTINVVHIVPAEVAEALRNPEEKGIKFRWQSLAVALDPLDFPGLRYIFTSSVSLLPRSLMNQFTFVASKFHAFFYLNIFVDT